MVNYGASMFTKIRLFLFLIPITLFCQEKVDSRYIFTNVFKLTWNRNTEQDLAGYKIYQFNKSDQVVEVKDVGVDTTYTWVVTKLDSFLQRIHFKVTAYDQEGNESGFSNKVSVISAQKKWLFGDYNEDGIIDLNDVLMFSIKFHTYDNKFDYNQDGVLDYTDHFYITLNHGKRLE